VVLIDTPPMVNIADARVIGQHADAVVLVVRSGVTSRDAALLARSRFADDGIPLLGTILNGWNPKTPGYSYFKYYYDGYRHYYGDGGGRDGGSPSSDDSATVLDATAVDAAAEARGHDATGDSSQPSQDRSSKNRKSGRRKRNFAKFRARHG